MKEVVMQQLKRKLEQCKENLSISRRSHGVTETTYLRMTVQLQTEIIEVLLETLQNEGALT